MKFELTEETLLKVSGAAALVYGASAAAAPRPYHDLFHTTVSASSAGGSWGWAGSALPAAVRHQPADRTPS